VKRLFLTTLVALLAAAVAHADSVIYQTRDTGFASAPAPINHHPTHFRGPRVRSGISSGITIGIGSSNGRVRSGISFSTGSTRVVTRRTSTVHTGGAIIRQSTVYPGYYGHTYGHTTTYGNTGYEAQQVGNRAESEARAKLSLLRSRIEAVGGALLEGGIRPAQVYMDGFNLKASSEVHATFLVPDTVIVQNGTPVARGQLELVIPKSGATIPVSCNEAVRLLRNPEGEKHTLLGALLRRAWVDARGELSKTKDTQLRIGGAMQIDFSSFDEAMGRRSFGRYHDLPQLTSRQVGLHAQAMQSALSARAAGDPAHYQALVGQRASRFAGNTQGLAGQVNGR